MGKFFVNVGNMLVISRKHRRVRKSVIFLFTNLLILAGLIFTLEVVLIFLGVGDVIIPLPFLKGESLINLVF